MNYIGILFYQVLLKSIGLFSSQVRIQSLCHKYTNTQTHTYTHAEHVEHRTLLFALLEIKL